MTYAYAYEEDTDPLAPWHARAGDWIDPKHTWGLFCYDLDVDEDESVSEVASKLLVIAVRDNVIVDRDDLEEFLTALRLKWQEDNE